MPSERHYTLFHRSPGASTSGTAFAFVTCACQSARFLTSGSVLFFVKIINDGCKPSGLKGAGQLPSGLGYRDLRPLDGNTQTTAKIAILVNSIPCIPWKGYNWFGFSQNCCRRCFGTACFRQSVELSVRQVDDGGNVVEYYTAL